MRTNTSQEETSSQDGSWFKQEFARQEAERKADNRRLWWSTAGLAVTSFALFGLASFAEMKCQRPVVQDDKIYQSKPVTESPIRPVFAPKMMAWLELHARR